MSPAPTLSSAAKRGSTQYLPIFIDRINHSLTSLTYSQANVGLFTGLVCASLIWYRLHPYVDSFDLNAWYGLIFVITILRASLVKIYFNQDNPEPKIKVWRGLFIIGSALGGICWGLLAIFLMPYVHSSDEVLLLMILAGITAGVVAFIAGLLTAAFAFLVTALGPVAVYFIFIKASPDYLTGATVTVYLLFLLMQSTKVHSMLQNGLLLQFELNEAKNQLEQTATHDPLTKVANRHLFNLKFEKAIETAKKTNSKIALLYLDLDKFKAINDIYGHQAGDQVLLVFVERLKTLFKEKDMIARLGGDEFTVTIDNFTKHKDLDAIAEDVYRVLETPVSINNTKLEVRASLGVSIYPTDGTDSETLLRVADSKMYSAKRALSN
jgi:diguanylate cyclase (GGDEF)-like protein